MKLKDNMEPEVLEQLDSIIGSPVECKYRYRHKRLPGEVDPLDIAATLQENSAKYCTDWAYDDLFEYGCPPNIFKVYPELEECYEMFVMRNGVVGCESKWVTLRDKIVEFSKSDAVRNHLYKQLPLPSKAKRVGDRLCEKLKRQCYYMMEHK